MHTTIGEMAKKSGPVATQIFGKGVVRNKLPFTPIFSRTCLSSYDALSVPKRKNGY